MGRRASNPEKTPRAAGKRQRDTESTGVDQDLMAEGESPTPGTLKQPKDVPAKTFRDLARLLGVHYNTLTNWKAKGIEPPGSPPYSLKAFCLMLRPAFKLPECRPTTKDARAVWSWAFGAGEGGSPNPDDPAHGPTVGWAEEDKRQAALVKLEQRRQERMKTDEIAGRLKDDDEVRAMLRELHALVVGELSSVQTIANQVRGLTPAQRADIGDALNQWQADAKQRISQASLKYVKTLEATRVDAG